jgi:hypothetical protein
MEEVANDLGYQKKIARRPEKFPPKCSTIRIFPPKTPK